jgi:hypothetical protein
MLTCPAMRRMLITRLRRAAMTCGRFRCGRWSAAIGITAGRSRQMTSAPGWAESCAANDSDDHSSGYGVIVRL